MGRTAPALLVMVSATLALAQDGLPWVGRKVVTRYSTPLRDGNQVVDDNSAFRVYTVERADGDRLRLVAGGVSGWAQMADVVPFDQAIDFFTREMRANPSSADACMKRGFIWAIKSEYDKAIADLDEAIRLDPKSARAYNGRGNAWREKHAYDKAIADYGEAIRLDPRLALAYNNRGTVWKAEKNYDQALADYDEAIRLDSKYINAYMNRANVWKNMGLHGKAVADYGEAIRLAPEWAEAYRSRGSAWLACKRHEDAVSDFNEAIRLDPKSAPAFNDRGLAYQAKKEYDHARSDFDEAIRLAPKSPLAYNNGAWLWASCPDPKIRDGKKAVEYATRACELSDWKDAPPLGSLAAACAELGDFDKAVEWQEKAIKLYTDLRDKEKGEELLKLYNEKKPYRE